MFKEGPFLKESQFAAFDEEREPGTEALFAGIYRCLECNREIVSDDGDVLPLHTHLRLDDDQRRAPLGPDAGQPDPEPPVRRREPHPPRAGALPHLQLVSQREHVKLEYRA